MSDTDIGGISPCPFCGTPKRLWVAADYRADLEEIHNFVECKHCLARGPLSNTSESDAIELWNEAALRVDLELERKEADDYKKLVEALHADLDAMRGRLDAARPRRFP